MRRLPARNRNRRSDWLVLSAAAMLALLVVGVASAHTAAASMACSSQAGATLLVNGSAYPAGSTYTYSIDGGATSSPLNANTGGTVSYPAGAPTIGHTAVVSFHTSDGLTQYDYVFKPSVAACVAPTPSPTASPTAEPTASPTAEPTASPTAEPTASPTAEPTASPTAEPTASPTAEPTASPTAEPTASPTGSVAGATGVPQHTAPPTDGLVVTAETVGSGLAAIVGAGVILLIALVLLTPARRRRPVRR